MSLFFILIVLCWIIFIDIVVNVLVMLYVFFVIVFRCATYVRSNRFKRSMTGSNLMNLLFLVMFFSLSFCEDVCDVVFLLIMFGVIIMMKLLEYVTVRSFWVIVTYRAFVFF